MSSSNTEEYIPQKPKITKNGINQSKTRENILGVQRGQTTNFSYLDENSQLDEKSELDEKDSENETDRFEQKRAKKDKSGGFGTNALKRKEALWNTVGVLKLMVGAAEAKLKRAEKMNTKMKTAIRKVVSVKRDIKCSLAVLTDGDSLLPRHSAADLKESKGEYDADGVRKWAATAFNATPDDEWLVIKVPKANRTHFMCDFCDGDELDNFEWLEGCFKQGLTVRELLEYRRGRTREKRRNITDNLHRRTQVRVFPSEPWERHEDSTEYEDTTSEEDGTNNDEMMKESFRKRVSYRPKPDLKDIFAAEKRRSENEESLQDSDSQSDKWSSGKMESSDKMNEEGRTMPCKNPRAGIMKGSPIQPIKKRKRQKKLNKSSSKGSTAEQKKPFFVDFYDNWEDPDYEVGDEVTFNSDNLGIRGVDTIMSLIRATRDKDGAPHDPIWLYEIDTVAVMKPGKNGYLKSEELKSVHTMPCLTITKSTVEPEALHPLDYVGIDTCSAMSVSTEVRDFLYLDTSKEACKSIELNGVGGGDSCVRGRGPMMVSVSDTEGKIWFLVDPAGVYLKSSATQARLRIYGQQRMKSFGFYLRQNVNGDGEDYLIYKDEKYLKMTTKRRIQRMKTGKPLSHELRKSRALQDHIQELLYKRKHEYCIDPERFNRVEVEEERVYATSLIVNEAKLTKIE
jgi:hypothetical protein